MILSEAIYQRNTKQLAQYLLGCFLRNETASGVTIGKIVETEAYLCKNDPACHAASGRTPRNEIMFGPPGYAYVYFIYGMYDLFNVVSGKLGQGEAILVRALEPIEGIALMKERRDCQNFMNLCNGPAKLVQAMGISRKLHNGACLKGSSLQILDKEKNSSANKSIITSSRIGISSGQDLLLRYYLAENRFVSKV